MFKQIPAESPREVGGQGVTMDTVLVPHVIMVMDADAHKLLGPTTDLRVSLD